MNMYDKGKLKVLIKAILIHNSPKELTSKQIADTINSHEWGFTTAITSPKIASIMNYELNKSGKHFMENIVMTKKNRINRYCIKSKDER